MGGPLCHADVHDNGGKYHRDRQRTVGYTLEHNCLFDVFTGRRHIQERRTLATHANTVQLSRIWWPVRTGVFIKLGASALFSGGLVERGGRHRAGDGAFPAEPGNLEPMADGVKMMALGDLPTEFGDFIRRKLLDASASSADHVVVWFFPEGVFVVSLFDVEADLFEYSTVDEQG